MLLKANWKDGSPPAWWCGLKYIDSLPDAPEDIVTTCVVVWIEIGKTQMGIALAAVTTCVVVWIEIYN